MRRIKLFSVFALVALLLSAGLGAVMAQEPPPSERVASNYREAQASTQLTEQEKIKNAIDSYFELRYESQRLLQPLDFSFLTADSPRAQGWAQREKDKREVELYNARLYKLNYVEYDYTLDYDSIEIEGKTATVRLRESHTVVFEAIAPQESAMDGLEHIITLRKTRAGWVIVRDEYQDEITQLMAGETKDEIIERIRLNHKAELQRTASFDAPQNTYESMTTRGLHSYERSLAVDYADRWGYWPGAEGGRNPDYLDYDTVPGANDCTNYVSQVIYEGTLHHDNPQWWGNRHGGSDAWIWPKWLGEFLMNNNGPGPHASKVSHPCGLRRGDVIQLKNNYLGWFHSLVVVDFDWWGCTQHGPGSSISYNAHSVDRFHYPFSWVSGYQKRYLHVTGWED